jgi:hypothetical protein
MLLQADASTGDRLWGASRAGDAMSWIWPDYIHRDLPLTKQERKAIYRDAWKLWWGNRWNLALYMAFCLAGFLALLNAAEFGGWVAGSMGISGLPLKVCRAATLLMVLLAAAIFMRAVLGRYRFAPCIYQATREHGYDVCAKCGYWLRGLFRRINALPGVRHRSA